MTNNGSTEVPTGAGSAVVPTFAVKKRYRKRRRRGIFVERPARRIPELCQERHQDSMGGRQTTLLIRQRVQCRPDGAEWFCGGGAICKYVAPTALPQCALVFIPTYSFPGVVHWLTRSLPFRSARQPVNNAAAMRFSTSSWLPIFCPLPYFGFGPGTNNPNVRWTNESRPFDRSRNPNTDTHPQVTTLHVSLYELRPAFISQHIVT